MNNENNNNFINFNKNSQDEIPEKIYNSFQNNLSPEKIIFLSKKLGESNKLISSYHFYKNAMNIVFENSNNIYSSIIDKIFTRFKQINLISTSYKETLYINNIKEKEYINNYEICVALSIFIKTTFEKKINLLFNLTDKDSDGLINLDELFTLIKTVNIIFSCEITPMEMNSIILNQSIINIKVKQILNLLLYEPGELLKNFKDNFYIDFGSLMNGMKKIIGYKFKIIPNFVNFKKSLNIERKEKKIIVKKNLKDEFLNVNNSIKNYINKKNNKNENINNNLLSENKSSFSMVNIFNKKKYYNINDDFEKERLKKRYGTIKIFKTNQQFNCINNISNNNLLNNDNNNIKMKSLLSTRKTFKSLSKKNIHDYNNNKSKKKFLTLDVNYNKIINNEIQPGLIEIYDNNNNNNVNNNKNSINNSSVSFKLGKKIKTKLSKHFNTNKTKIELNRNKSLKSIYSNNNNNINNYKSYEEVLNDIKCEKKKYTLFYDENDKFKRERELLEVQNKIFKISNNVQKFLRNNSGNKNFKELKLEKYNIFTLKNLKKKRNNNNSISNNFKNNLISMKNINSKLTI